jgi:Fe-S-cluster containining protein
MGFEKGKKLKWFGEGLRFECQQCKTCCKNFLLNGKRVAHVFLKDDEFTNFEYSNLEVVKPKSIVLKVKSNGDCIYLGSNGCTVYDKRPEQCRTYPFWSDLMNNKKQWKFLGKSCHGIGKGRLYSLEEIERIKTT